MIYQKTHVQALSKLAKDIKEKQTPLYKMNPRNWTRRKTTKTELLKPLSLFPLSLHYKLENPPQHFKTHQKNLWTPSTKLTNKLININENLKKTYKTYKNQ